MFELTFPETGRTIKANEAGDTSSFDALVIAKELKAKGLVVIHAGVDRFEGLVLVGSRRAWRFKNAICSFDGTGPQTTAEILELFGFGKKADTMKVISNQNQSRYFFKR